VTLGSSWHRGSDHGTRGLTMGFQGRWINHGDIYIYSYMHMYAYIYICIYICIYYIHISYIII
jgi:hypothetical protein